MSSDAEMTVTVRLYSILRNRNGQVINSLQLKLPEGCAVSEVLTILEVPEELDIVLAIRDQLSSKTSRLKEHDCLAIIPAIAGGATDAEPHTKQ